MLSRKDKSSFSVHGLAFVSNCQLLQPLSYMGESAMTWKLLLLALKHLCLCHPMNVLSFFLPPMEFSSNVICSKQTSLERIGHWILCASSTFFFFLVLPLHDEMFYSLNRIAYKLQEGRHCGSFILEFSSSSTSICTENDELLQILIEHIVLKICIVFIR